MLNPKLVKSFMDSFLRFHSKIGRMRSFVPIKGISEKYGVGLAVNQKGMEK